MIKKFSIVLLFVLSSCGYESLYLKNKIQRLEFSKVHLEGDKQINRNIIKKLLIKETPNGVIKEEIFLNSNYIIEETSKNSKGKAETYKSTINISLKITSAGKVLKNQNFNKSFNYKAKENKYDLVVYQNEIKNILISNISEDILLNLNTQ